MVAAAPQGAGRGHTDEQPDRAGRHHRQRRRPGRRAHEPGRRALPVAVAVAVRLEVVGRADEDAGEDGEAGEDAGEDAGEEGTGGHPREKQDDTPSRTATKAPPKPSAPAALSEESAAAAQVLKLVNEERAKVGCSAVAANSALTELAQDYSEDMAARGFFDHTDPDGRTPWDRAEKAGISNLGGENIARGQADAAAVMDAWMNSPGHRANILNCDFKTLGVGVELGSGGPWWTQDFGY
ncbi:hypothetical protein STAFG_1065 [Streptomyces afghaniensis 772]|uniref:SCP domain-containing protein n=1 Tax=Streptomyces afghaniensis 772 TaxID=1283301 RepID=S4MXU6_9ACTN|nr:hypothetical protein STAFG_1065 [Streptomyces afghaniensis 772]